jgi:plastocyanin
MILRWLICFSLIAAMLDAATISGTVELRDSRVASVSRQKDFSGVVVSAESVDRTSAPPPGHAVMLQKGKMFTPHILAVTAGTSVDFPNSDPIFHNAFSSYDGQIFDVGLYPPGSSKSVRFVWPGVVRVFCNIHPTMSAIVLVLNTPYFTPTAKDGSFQLDLPPGEYQLNVFHERATVQTLAGLKRRIVVTGQPARLTPITVSEAGYLPAAHKNKYGTDYAAPPDDRVFYPGVRN